MQIEDAIIGKRVVINNISPEPAWHGKKGIITKRYVADIESHHLVFVRFDFNNTETGVNPMFLTLLDERGNEVTHE